LYQTGSLIAFKKRLMKMLANERKRFLADLEHDASPISSLVYAEMVKLSAWRIKHQPGSIEMAMISCHEDALLNLYRRSKDVTDKT